MTCPAAPGLRRGFLAGTFSLKGAIDLANQNTLRSRELMMREARTAYLFLLPCLIFFVGFVVFPMFICIFYSLTNANMNAKAATEFIGLLNFQQLFSDKTFLEALRNTFVIVIVSVPAVCAFSLWVSSAIYKLSGPVLSTFRRSEERRVGKE